MGIYLPGSVVIASIRCKWHNKEKDKRTKKSGEIKMNRKKYSAW
jgi:hypothetical protein